MGLDLHELSLPARLRCLHRAGLRYRMPAASSPYGHQKPCAAQEDQPQAQAEPAYPLPWSKLWASMSPPYAMIWTYWHMALDLGFSPSAQRRSLFNTILARLGWPRGTVGFWPLAAGAENELTPYPDIFWSGVQALQAQIVVVFGRQAFSSLFPKSPAAFGFTSTPEGLQIVHVPAPEDMLPDKREMKNLTWNMLCSLSRPKDPEAGQPAPTPSSTST